MKNYFKLIASIALPLLFATAGSMATSSSVDDWYQTLNKPFFNPPNWLFGPVWTILYIFMGVAFYLLWTAQPSKNRKISFGLYFAQLFLNLFWSIAFFGLQNPLLAFITIIFLWLMILLSIIFFRRTSKQAGFLFVPYFIWVSFASLLNLFIFLLN